LRNIPEYFEDIFNKKKYRHKDDKEELKLEEVSKISKKGVVKAKTKGIIFKLPGIEFYLKKISKIIDRKNLKYYEYAEDLSHINLIINDTENFLFQVKLQKFSDTFFSKEITKSVLDSNFREIYFVTTVDKDKRLYFPLKMMLFLSRIKIFTHFLHLYHRDDSELSDEDQYSFFIEYLKCQGFSKVRRRVFRQKKEIIYGNVGFYMENDTKPVLKDYQDSLLPNDAIITKVKKFKYITDDVKRKIEEFQKSISFKTEIGSQINE